MSDVFSTMVAMQREVLLAQKAGLDAAQAMIDVGRRVGAAQQMSQTAAEANVKAWKAWAGLWGWK